ncbi:hypothetical protein J3L19_21915 [Mucilaginibacter rubeus]|uniref:hypothetical protein n=1 Tax=Mucilaginibacter rubeus TaxID=2027860 RepID=UPI001AA0B695|nr:hypothetical protein [Mucilaginibacter rubeus]QTE41588.1 hypothetical protein J3L19_21915 [Mucilaginibacter rubeus]
MKYKVFIGIDVSKLTIDVHLHGIGASKTFSNEEKGFALFLSWVKSIVNNPGGDDHMLRAYRYVFN